MKVGGELVPRCPVLRLRWNPSVLTSPGSVDFLVRGACLAFRGGWGESQGIRVPERMALFYVVMSAFGVELIEGRGGAVPRQVPAGQGRGVFVRVERRHVSLAWFPPALTCLWLPFPFPTPQPPSKHAHETLLVCNTRIDRLDGYIQLFQLC